MALAANFTGLPLTGAAPLSVLFTNTSGGGGVIIKWQWDFGDGFTSTSENPGTHVYKRAGTYTVSLTVWDDLLGSDTETKVEYIVVGDPAGLEDQNTCLRYATEKTEGIGWSECNGDSWVDPKDNWGVFPILDEYRSPRMLILDATDHRYYELDTYDRINDIKSPALDKEDVDDTEIAWEDWQREDVVSPIDENEKQLHEESHVYVRPTDPGNREKSGYTDTGLRSAQELTLEQYIDGEKITPSASTHDFPENGDIVFSGNRIPARRSQLVIKGTASEIQIVAKKHEYLKEPGAGSRSEREMTEITHEEDLSLNFVVNIGRATDKPLYDKANKRTLSASYFRITGPDGRSNSGIVLRSNLNLRNAAIPGNYTICLWSDVANPMPGVVFTQYGATYSGWMLLYSIGAGLGSNMVLSAGNDIYVVRIYSAAIAVNAFRSFYNDVTRNEGQEFLGF